MTLRKERLEEIAELARKATYKPCAMHMTNLLAVCGSEVIEEMARKLLAGMAQEPYGYVHKEVYESEGSCGLSSDHEAHRDSRTHIPLYAAPQLPQPAVVVNRKAIADRVHGQCSRIPGATFYNAAELALDEVEACRAAMLQAGNHTEQHLDMVDHSGEANEKVHDQTQFKPVADLYGITSPTGSETSFTFDAIEAVNFIEGGWSVQEYVELERYQEAMIGNSPATPDGWVMVPVEPTPEMRDAYHNAQEEYESVDGLWSPDHQWKAMIAAAPKEVG